MRFSLLFFANTGTDDARDQYDLLGRAAELADAYGLAAVWVPERHFHEFGGALPNPAIAACVAAMRTKRIRIRAGSVVLPLHDGLRAVEDGSVVDNVSGGRVDIAFATGWNATDFVLAPDRYAKRQECTLSAAREFDQLWRGEPACRPNGQEEEVKVRTYPRPVQPAPGYCLTCTATPEPASEAGENGFIVLTALLCQTPGQVQANLERDRAARAGAGLAGRGQVTLMLHTYPGYSDSAVRETVREPFVRYLESSMSLWKSHWKELDVSRVRDKRLLLQLAFDRYARSAALFGTVGSCEPMVRQLADAGVDEIACLVDFGLPTEQVLESVEHIARLASAAAAY